MFAIKDTVKDELYDKCKYLIQFPLRIAWAGLCITNNNLKSDISKTVQWKARLKAFNLDIFPRFDIIYPKFSRNPKNNLPTA